MNVVLKKLTNSKVHFSVASIFASYFGLPVSFMISLIMLLTGATVKDPAIMDDIPSLFVQIFYSLMSASCGVVSQICINLSLKHEDASKVTIIRSTDIFFTYIFQFFFLNITTNLYSAIGACLIVFGTVLILLYKLVDKKIVKSNDKSAHFLKRIFIYKF